jgi:hypothetical protein
LVVRLNLINHILSIDRYWWSSPGGAAEIIVSQAERNYFHLGKITKEAAK